MTMLAAIIGGGFHLGILPVIGGALLFGTLGARLFQKIHFPQVVGYIIVGLVIGRSGLGLIDTATLDALEPFNFFALGIIGFMIGGELHRDVFRKYGKQFMTILFSQGIGTFVVVSVLTAGVLLLMTGDIAASAAVGIVLGAICSATAPAATVEVLREYKTRGVLTTTVYAIVALDDGLALILYGISTSIAAMMLSSAGDNGGITAALGVAAYKLFVAIILGVLAGMALNAILRRGRDREKALTYIIGSLALVIGLCALLNVDEILAPMALGVVIINLAPRRSYSAFGIVERFAPPIYVLFFVLAGAHVRVTGMGLWMCGLAAAYLVGRLLGKILGANLGARLAESPAVVRKYLGLCLFSQGGVAIGLALAATKRFTGVSVAQMPVGTMIMMIIMLTTLVVELLGPPCVKLAVQKAGEVGLNVTEDDLMESYTVADMMDASAATFAESAPLTTILRTISDTDAMSYSVVDDDDNLAGVISLADLKQSFSAEGLTAWLVAFDLMRPAVATIDSGAPLAEAVTRMNEQGLECLPVLAGEDDPRLVGMIELRAVNRQLSREILRRQQLADDGST